MNKKAFTILEILVVLTVLAILIGIAVPRIKGMQDQANIQKAQAELRTLQVALESYYVNSSPNAYPANIGAALTGASPQILQATLVDPFTSSGYGYATTGKYYVVYSAGPDGTAGDGSAYAISAGGVVTHKGADDICVTNGSGC
ncbi:MAG: prepilin-type N-terminal cleavage/methylation domain-containing protein [Candidatus Omnitrophica bacterium]|nr:prepilin-type N-terminal cleavage/methylation domain-containing protein [Candidatus Omnitrophota bacterium]